MVIEEKEWSDPQLPWSFITEHGQFPSNRLWLNCQMTIWPRKHKRKTPFTSLHKIKKIYRIGRGLTFWGTVRWGWSGIRKGKGSVLEKLGGKIMVVERWIKRQCTRSVLEEHTRTHKRCSACFSKAAWWCRWRPGRRDAGRTPPARSPWASSVRRGRVGLKFTP